MNTKITQHTIAQALGVTIGTVDRALHNRKGISAATKQRIIEFVNDNGYQPDRIASSLAKKSRPIRIGVILQSFPEFFWSQVHQGVFSVKSEAVDYGFQIDCREFHSIRGTPDILKLFDDLINSGVDAIIIVPSMDPLIRDRISEAVSDGIPIVTLNDDVEDSGRLFYVGSQMKQSGRVAGEMMGRYLKGLGNVLIINGDIETVGYNERILGFKEVLTENFKGINVIGTNFFSYNSLQEEIGMLLQKAVDSSEYISGIYDVDGSSLYAAGDWLRRQKLYDRFTLIGHEIWSEVEKLISENIIQACISQNPYTQGYYAIKLLENFLITGVKPFQDRIYTRIDIIIKENLTTSGNIINPYLLNDSNHPES